MKIYNYGNPGKNSLFLLPGSCAHPENYFAGIREYLEKFYNVFRVGYTGFNKTENTDFVSVIRKKLSALDDKAALRRFFVKIKSENNSLLLYLWFFIKTGVYIKS